MYILQYIVLQFTPPCVLSLTWLCDILDESGQDDGAAKTNPSLTREKDLVVNISDLDNIFDEDEEELGVNYNVLCIFLHVTILTTRHFTLVVF